MAAYGGNSLDFTKRFGVEFLDELRFESEDYIPDIRRRCEKKLKKKHIFAENKWFLSLYEEEFRKKIVPKLEIKWINHRIGHGVFAKERIPELTYIGEYAGLVRKRKWRRDRYNSYIFAYSIARKLTRYLIDAKEQGSFVRFINHSDEPNVASHWMIVDGINHIIMHTIKPIPAGGQLTYDYGPGFWKRRTTPTEL